MAQENRRRKTVLLDEEGSTDITGMSVVSYVAERNRLVPDAIPVLLRNVRGADGRIHEQSWRPRKEQWVPSWHQYEAELGKNDNDFEEIDEEVALAIQEARRRQIAQLDGDT